MKTLLAVTCSLALSILTAQPARAAAEKFKIATLSSRPDMVSGGDVLVRVSVPPGIALEKLVIKLNGREVTSSFHADTSTHSLTGLVAGLKPGDNQLEVFSAARSKPAAKATIQNHPITGPIFSGPQEQPFVCQTQDFLLPDNTPLGAPIDANCSVKTVVTYLYKSTEPAPRAPSPRGGGAAIKPLANTAALPPDVAWTTTTTGEKVPYVVRVETGTINRAIYQFAVLDDPTKGTEPGPFAPPREWNRRLLYSFGGGCTGGWLKQGKTLGWGGGSGPTAMMNDSIVGKGYAEASATLNVFGNNCNDVLAAETMMMVKERFIKAFGPPAFTLSRGGSGGSYQQIQIADNYPGLLDGIIPSLTFPDVLDLTQMLVDSQLLNQYYTKSGNTLSPEQKRAIAGVGEIENITLADSTAQAGRVTATVNCPPELAKSLLYDPVSNRTGARCDVFDHTVNVYGRDPATGFARRPLDNVGVQYGLAALNDGTITTMQFLDLNEAVGGYDNDGNVGAKRAVADELALEAAYQTGRIAWGGHGLGQLPIIDVRPYRDLLPKGDPHLKYHSFSLRERLRQTNGNFDNDVMLVEFPADRTGQMEEEAIAKMDEWLTRLANDTSGDPMPQKVLRAKPTDLVDACFTATGDRIVEPQTPTGGQCNTLYKTFPSPRMVAGAPASTNVLKCQLKPIDFKNYMVSFTDPEKARLKAIFPDGVCDWTKPGVEQQASKGTWLNYSAAADR